MHFRDRSIQRLDCGADFASSIGDREFFGSRGYANELERHPTCRGEKKIERSGAEGSAFQRPSPDVPRYLCPVRQGRRSTSRASRPQTGLSKRLLRLHRGSGDETMMQAMRRRGTWYDVGGVDQGSVHRAKGECGWPGHLCRQAATCAG